VTVDDLGFMPSAAFEFGVVTVYVVEVGALISPMAWLYRTDGATNRGRQRFGGGTFSAQRRGHLARTSTSVVPTKWSGSEARMGRHERRVETARRRFYW
jgi:hypothetical protein